MTNKEIYTRQAIPFPSYSIGPHTYGTPKILDWSDGGKLIIGDYTSIADEVTILLGGNHHPEWVTTYPFSSTQFTNEWPEAKNIEGQPWSKGNVVIGNDVWIGYGATILSGVTIGNGAVIAAKAMITKDVAPYSIVGGNPARLIRMRFGSEVVERLNELAWWNWDEDKIRENIELLCSTNMSKLLGGNYEDKRVIEKILPRNSKRRSLLKKVYAKVTLLRRLNKTVKTSIDYQSWVRDIEPKYWISPKEYINSPMISIVVPVYNTPDKYIKPLVDSLIAQTYSNWQLCLADASTDEDRSQTINLLASTDGRISYKKLNSNGGISDNTIEAIKLSKGDYIGFLDHDDTLSSHAIQEVVDVINKNPEAAVIYSDEDKLSDDGTERLLPFFKPDWSPDLLTGVNYITHFLVVKKSLLDEVGGPRSVYDGAQDYDLLLRLTEKTDKIFHIPKILYHWRLADGSTAKSVGEKNYADDAGQKALRDAVRRRGINAEVVGLKDHPTNYRLRYNLPKKEPMVSIIIPFKDKADLLEKCVASIFDKTTYKNYELILISNNSVERETTKLVDALRKNVRVTALEWNKPFNYSKINNFGVKKARGEYIVLLNNDTEVISSTWLEELVGVAMQPGVGAVGPLLLYPDHKNGIQHAGVILGMGTMAGHVFRHRQPEEWTDFGMPSWPRNYLAVTAACLVVSKKLYEKVGGLDEKFIVAGNDVAFCLRLHEAGYRNIYWPFAQLYHYESVSVGTYNNGIQSDYDHSLTYYKPYHDNGDPYFNKNLDLMNEQIGIGEKR